MKAFHSLKRVEKERKKEYKEHLNIFFFIFEFELELNCKYTQCLKIIENVSFMNKSA